MTRTVYDVLKAEVPFSLARAPKVRWWAYWLSCAWLGCMPIIRLGPGIRCCVRCRMLSLAPEEL